MGNRSCVALGLVLVVHMGCSGEDDATGSTSTGTGAGTTTDAGVGGSGGHAGEGGTGAGGSGMIPANSQYPKLNLLTWGGGSPAWYALFDWVIMPGSGLSLAAQDLNPSLKISITRDWNCCIYQGGACPAAWRVKDAVGNDISCYGTCYLGDTSDHCGEHDGMTYREYIVQWTQNQNWTPLDGWNSDGVWENIFWKGAIDIDHDGDSDGTDEQLWREGRAKLFAEVRAALPAEKFMTLWAGKVTDFWGEGPKYLNGVGAEKFMVFSGWGAIKDVYQSFADQAPEPHMFYINNSHEGDPDPDAASRNNFRNMRFGLATTLLHDGYYSYEDGDSPKHNEHWWVRYFDEYDVPLGEPLGDFATIRDDVFCRFFEGGAMILNGATQDEAVTEGDLMTAAASLGLDWAEIAGIDGHFYRFSGQQNPDFNDGSVFSEAVLPSKEFNGSRRKGDGILLVRTPNQVVAASVIIDTESFVTSPGAEDAVLVGFEGACGDETGFRTGYGHCSATNPLYGYAVSSPDGGNAASYEAVLVHEGMYEVFEYHPAIDGYDVPHTITHADGVDEPLVDQRVDFEKWNSLGTYRFTPSAPASVVISADGNGSSIAADAIRFVWAGPS